MNKTGIDWTDYSWNPVTGCEHGCSFCYARKLSARFGRSFKPELHADRLRQPELVAKPSTVFVCSMADLFGKWVPAEWIGKVMAHIKRAPQHTYIFLTKNPERLATFNPWPANCWVGSSAINEAGMKRAQSLERVQASVRFISAEPLLGDLGTDNLSWLDWVIVGAQTGPERQPVASHVQRILNAAKHTPIFMKENLIWQPRRAEFPTARPVQGPIQAPLFSPVLQPA